MKEKIDFINSLTLDERIKYWQDLIMLANQYLKSENITDDQSLSLINCINGLRTSRFIQTEIDLELLDASLPIARILNNQKTVLKGILNDILYYSNFYPEKYNKDELEKELNELNKN